MVLTGVFFIAIIVGLIIGLGILILFCLTLKNTIQAADLHNQVVEPNRVWLLLIPFFNIIYMFILYPKISETIKNQLEENNAGESGDYGLTLGRVYPIAYILQYIIPVQAISGLLSLGGFVCFIIFWVKMGSYKNKMIATKGQSGGIRGAVNNNPDLLD